MKMAPAQKAIIQFIESILITAIIVGLFDISLLPKSASIQQIAATFFAAVLVSLVHSLIAYLKALPGQNNGLAAALDAALNRFLPQFTAALPAPIQQTVTPAQPATQPMVQVPAPILQQLYQQQSIAPFTTTGQQPAIKP